jgi:hypothetical protein
METGGSSGAPLGWYRTAREPLRLPRGRWRWLSRERIIDALGCLSLSALCFSQTCHEMLFRADRDFYNRLLLGTPTLVALIANVVTLALVGLVLVEVIRRARPPIVRRLAAVAAAGMLVIGLNFARMTYVPVAVWTDAIGRSGLVAIVIATLVAAVGWPRVALRAVRSIALIASPIGVLAVLLAGWMFLELAAGPVWRRVDPAPLKTSAPSLRRVVWLVFEELDQKLTFEERPPGLELPELDRLRRESLYADAARPPAGTTEVSMAALITGRPVVAVLPVTPNDAELTMADGKTVFWSAHPSVFSRARVFGYDGAVVGWQLPYPRVLGASLGAAEWRPSAAYEQTRGVTVGDALLNQWASLAPPVHVRRLSAERLAELGELAMRAATDGRFGIVLLHLPLPRPPGVYDRATGRLTSWNFTGAEAESLDNLALVDRVMGELRRGLVNARLGDRTWIVVSSNRRSPAVDHRVPFLVRSPDGGPATHVDGAFNTLGTQDLVLAILRGSITDTVEAATWLRRFPSASPKDYTSHGRPIY